jgi:putative DNA primase/helicase
MRVEKISPQLPNWIVEDLVKSGLEPTGFPVIPLASDEQAHQLLGFTELDGVRLVDIGGYFIPYPNHTDFYRLKLRQPIGDAKYLSPKDAGVRSYILPEVLAIAEDFRPDKYMLITEGEKKAVAATKAGFATIGLGGVWGFKSGDCEFLPELESLSWKYRKVYICFDSDITQKHSVRQAELRLAVELMNRGGSPLSVRLPGEPDDMKNGLDDYLARYGPSAFQKLLDEATSTFELHVGEGTPVSLIVEEAARLKSPIQRERILKVIAKSTGVPVHILREELKKLAPQTTIGGKPSGALLAYNEVEAWLEPVDGGALLKEVSRWFTRYVVLPPGAADVMAVWTALTWFHEEVYFAPILALLSPTKRSGKTTTLDLLRHVVWRGQPTSGVGITSAVLFRLNDEYHPTLLIDEAEKLSSIADGKEIIGLLNAGHRRGGKVQRCAGDDNEVREFDAFGFRAVAAIGTLWDTLMDRAVVIRLQRKSSTDLIERFSGRCVEEEGTMLARKIARWVEDNREAVKTAEVSSPRPLWMNDRACDNWAPLFAVAQVAGMAWLQRLLDAAKSLQGSEDEADMGERLIRDIQTVFEQKGNPEAIASQELVQTLNRIETSPWTEYKGTGLTVNKLAAILKPFNIHPRLARIDGEPTRGYWLTGFRDIFSRYSRTEGVTTVTGVTVFENQQVTEGRVLNVEKSGPAATDSFSNGVTDVTLVTLQNEHSEACDCFKCTPVLPDEGEWDLDCSSCTYIAQVVGDSSRCVIH